MKLLAKVKLMDNTYLNIQWEQWDEESQQLINCLDGNVYGCWVYIDNTTRLYHLMQPYYLDSDVSRMAGIVLDDAQKGEAVRICVAGYNIMIDGKRVAPYILSSFAGFINDELDMGDDA